MPEPGTATIADAFSSGAEADARRAARRRALMPGAPRDRFVKAAKVGFPVATVLLLAAILLIPLNDMRELSFLLSKDAAEQAGERLRITRAEYRGKTAQGEPFAITAASAVQRTSNVPVVVLRDLAARIERSDGPASFTSPGGYFYLETDLLELTGPLQLQGGAGYRVDGQKVLVDIANNRVRSALPVEGDLPMGRFSADSFEAELDGSRVVMEGRVRMRLNPERMP